MTEALRQAGRQLANVAFNWAQRCGHTLTGDDVALLDKLRKEWDAALAQPPAPTAQPAESTTGQPLRSICWANCPCRKTAQPVQQPGAEPAGSATFGALKAVTAQCNRLREALELAASFLTDEQTAAVAAAMPLEGAAQAAPAQRQPLTVPALTDAQMSECAWGYVADSRNLDAGVTGIIQATQLACAAAWGVTLAQKGEKL